MDWKEQYKHPNWQKRRLERLEASGWACEECSEHDGELHVHHPRYYKDRKVWEYSDEELVVLCDECHKEMHHVLDAIKDGLACAGYTTLLSILGYIKASVSESEVIDVDEVFECDGIADALGMKFQDVVNLTKNGKFPINEVFKARAAAFMEKKNGSH